ncbi:MAG: response regulator [Pleurocapsa minor GSE-CHR-MK-17-07R]|nr:response regulator [Pleurocapsa minor GSE-CHR-MK 17-07R]
MTTENAPLVLIVDDEVNTTIMMEHVFTREGFRVARVNNGPDALNYANIHTPDLILLDILMPGMNGFEVLKTLKDNSRTVAIPIILITANARTPEDVAKGLGLGADDYVYKPFAPQELIARAQSKIRGRKLEEALERRSRELEVMLNATEVLNQHLAIPELLDLAPSLFLDLLPGDCAAIVLYKGDPSEVSRTYFRTAISNRSYEPDLIHDILSASFHGEMRAWSSSDTRLLNCCECGIVAELRHGNESIGRIAVIGDNITFSPYHLQLCGGILRQLSLALHNAQLYQQQINYASLLETMVAERTEALESAQKMLLRSEKLASIGHLAASIAHEINNPLMPIRTLLEGIVEDMEDRRVEYDRESVEIIQTSIERIRRIVSRLLEFSRDKDTELSLIDVNEVLEAVISLNNKFFQHERIDIVRDFRATAPMHGSKDQIEQVFMNMFLNAQAAMPRGGTLTLRTYEKNDAIYIEVADSGLGIAPESLSRLFDPFYSTKPNGTGLGLFVCHGIIEAHNGTIDVASKPGKGSTFTIKLPVFKSITVTSQTKNG